MAVTKQQIRDYVREHRDETAAGMPDTLIDRWIGEGLRRIRRERRTWPGYEKTSTLTTVAGYSDYPIGDISGNFKEVTDIQGGNGPLRYIDPTSAEIQYWNADTASEPREWSVFNDTIRLWPTPTSEYTFNVRGYRHPVDPSVIPDTTALDLPTEDADDVLVSWVLMKAAEFLEDGSAVQQFTSDFADGVKHLAVDETSTPLTGPLVMNSRRGAIETFSDTFQIGIGGGGTGMTLTTGSIAPTIGLQTFNVKHYGAKGDGVTNDTAAIVSAIAAASDPDVVDGTGRVYFPEGTYLVSTLNAAPSGGLAYGIGLPSNVVLDGVPGQSIIAQGFAYNGTGNTTIFQNADVTNGNGNITVQNLKFSMPAFTGVLPNLSTFGFGFNLNGCTDVTFENNHFGNCMLQGKPKPSQINQPNAHTLGLNQRWQVVGNIWDGPAESLAWYHGKGLIFAFNKIYNSYDSSFSINSSGEDIVIANNLFDGQGNAWAGLAHIELTNDHAGDTNGIRDVSISNNVLVDKVYANCKGIQTNGCANVTVNGNEIRNVGHVGIYAGDGSSNVSISGNTVVGCTNAGIKIANDGSTGANDFSINGNVVKGNGAGGITLGGGAQTLTAVSITGNICRGNTGGAGIGPSANVTAKTGIIADNICYGNTGAPAPELYVTGTGWTVRDNPGTDPTYNGLPGVRLTKSGTQSIAHNDNTTPLSFDVESEDYTDMHSSGTPSRITIATPGVYSIFGLVALTASAAGSIRLLTIKKNGGDLAPSFFGPLHASAQAKGAVACRDRAVAGDYYELVIYQDSGGALNAFSNCVLMAQMVSD